MKKNQFSFFTVAPYMKTLESKREKITVEMSTVYFTLKISREPPRSSETAAIMADNTMATRLMIKEKIAAFQGEWSAVLLFHLEVFQPFSCYEQCCKAIDHTHGHRTVGCGEGFIHLSHHSYSFSFLNEAQGICKKQEDQSYKTQGCSYDTCDKCNLCKNLEEFHYLLYFFQIFHSFLQIMLPVNDL